MTVRAPCMEGEHRSQHPESYEGQREEQALSRHRDRVLRDFEDVHRVLPSLGCGVEIDPQDPHQQERRTTHEHQGKFHRCILLAARTPQTDQQVHRDQCDLVEHEHREQVDRDKEPEHAQRKEHQPHVVFLGLVLDGPRSKHTGEEDDGRKHQHGYRNTVHPDGVMDVQRSEPQDAVGVQHRRIGTCRPIRKERHQQVNSCRQHSAGSRNGHRMHLFDAAAKQQRQEHQYRYDNKKGKEIHSISFLSDSQFR